MPIPTSCTETLKKRVESRHRPFVFLETDSQEMQDVLENIVKEYCQTHNAVYTDNIQDSAYVAALSRENKDTRYMVHIRDWERYSGNDIMLAFNIFFEEEMQRHGPNSRCDPRFRYQRLKSDPDGNLVPDDEERYTNVKLVFSGTAEPTRDDGLRHRLMSYRVTM